MLPWRYREQEGASSSCPSVLANILYIFLASEKSRLSFKWSNLFSGFPWGFAGTYTYRVPFLDLLGFCVLIVSNPFPRFSQDRLFPIMVAIWAPTVHTLKLYFTIWLLLHMSLVGGPAPAPFWLPFHMRPARNLPPAVIVPWGD